MKLETLFSIFIIALLCLMTIVERDVVFYLGLFSIGWNLPDISKFLAARFRNRNRVEA